ncbi:serine protease HTRA3 [Manacus vitellinus]|uniref:serine protease HTRA3 n=1 Tax=Manacus vitellinus TaxID=328815 RepID=UPI00115C8724|nr:serine protease HTRA3 [Manacus vitellinus]
MQSVNGGEEERDSSRSQMKRQSPRRAPIAAGVPVDVHSPPHPGALPARGGDLRAEGRLCPAAPSPGDRASSSVCPSSRPVVEPVAPPAADSRSGLELLEPSTEPAARLGRRSPAAGHGPAPQPCQASPGASHGPALCSRLLRFTPAALSRSAAEALPRGQKTLVPPRVCRKASGRPFPSPRRHQHLARLLPGPGRARTPRASPPLSPAEDAGVGLLSRAAPACRLQRRPATPRSFRPPRQCPAARCVQVPSPSCPSGYVPDRCGCCLICAAGEGDSCGRKEDPPCGDSLDCRYPMGKRFAKGVCQCKLSAQVCGSDGRTYDNICHLKAVSRKALQHGLPAVAQVQKGACESGHLQSNSPRYKFNFIADVVEKIAPAVVHIELFLRHPLFGRNVPLSSGSGFIMSDSGLIVTNAHVVSSTNAISGRQQLKVQLQDGDTYEATIKDIDKKSDIATIKIHPKKKLPVLLLGQSADLRPGEFVVAIGSPFALQNTVTTGIVSTAQRDGKELGLRDSDMDYIQTDAIINYGNSGGPLVNLDGEVIGINTLKVTAGISFAIPSDRITQFLTESQDKQSKDGKKRFIGIRMLTITPALVEELKHNNADFPDVRSGIYVHEVVPNSPSHRGGIQDGDIIVKVNGRPLMTSSDLQEAVMNESPLLLEVRRGNDDLLFNIEPEVVM